MLAASDMIATSFLPDMNWFLYQTPHRLYAVVTREIKLIHNYLSLRQCPTEIILFQRVETCLKLFQNYFRRLLQLVNIVQDVQCR